MGRIGAILLVVLIVAPILFLVLSKDSNQMSPIEHAGKLTQLNFPESTQVLDYADTSNEHAKQLRSTRIALIFNKADLPSFTQQCIEHGYKQLPITDSNSYYNIPGAYYHERSGYYKLTRHSADDERDIRLELLDTIKGELSIKEIVR